MTTRRTATVCKILFSAAMFGAGLIGGYTLGRDRVTTTTTTVEPAPRVIFVSEPQTQVEWVEPGKGRR